MRQFLGLFTKVHKAREIPSFTQFLVNNPIFRRLVITFHQEKTKTMGDLDKYFEKELLPKEQYDAKYNAKRIDTQKTRNPANRQ